MKQKKMKIKKIGFFISKDCPPEILYEFLRFCINFRNLDNIEIIGGFQGKMEQDILDILRNRKLKIGIFLPRTLYKKIPLKVKEDVLLGKIEYYSIFNSEDITKKTCYLRNRAIVEMCDEFIIPYYKSNSMTEETVMYIKEMNKKIYDMRNISELLGDKNGQTT